MHSASIKDKEKTMTIKVKYKNCVTVSIKELMNDKDFNIRMEAPLYSKDCVLKKQHDAIMKEIREKPDRNAG